MLFAGLLLGAVPSELAALCASSGTVATVGAVVRRIEDEEIRYVFVGERHGIGPVKRFTADLANELVARGHDVGLYVEGFRAGCDPGDESCRDLARLFNGEAFSRLLRESRAPVHPLDPAERDRRTLRMAATIAGGPESLRIVLVGRSHVVSAWDPDAELWVYGGGVRYPDPGDLVEAFPRAQALTMAFEPGSEPGADEIDPYRLQVDGCEADYRLVAPRRADY